MGFNCVRLTWPLCLVTNDSLASVTVRKSFQNLGLVESISGIQANNQSLLDLPVIEALQAVVNNLAENDVMVILDNHISKPGSCFEDNGFFGDDPQLWIKGLTKMASIFNGSTSVVGMSLRNELRGRKQNVKDWYKYMQQGDEAVHVANPNVLVILSGLNFDADLSFFAKQPVNLTFTGKLLYEVHFTNSHDWENGNVNHVCGNIMNNWMRRAGFLLEQGVAPLFLSEFGIDQRGVNDNGYLNCLMGVAAEFDLDWALWSLVGNYNSSFMERISSIQAPLQGPGISKINQYEIIFHPSTGLCVHRKALFTERKLKLGSLSIKGTYFFIQADGIGKPAKLGIICTDTNSQWEMVSESNMHLQSKLTDKHNTAVCLDVGSNNTIVTNSCKCLSRDKKMCDPSSQWFKIVNSTRSNRTI
ncbi:hypothetical protein MKW92_035576 [Papaver armeniacum]|nr:hypothetical protein MKW92_035576 [Papaver armeniacum]